MAECGSSDLGETSICPTLSLHSTQSYSVKYMQSKFSGIHHGMLSWRKRENNKSLLLNICDQTLQ